MKRIFLVLAALAAAAAMATGASAAPAGVSIPVCAFAGGATVPAGTPVAVKAGWGTKTKGQGQSFLNAVTASAAIDGVPLANPNSYFSKPEGSNGGFATYWSYATGRTLAAGESLVVTLDWYLSHPVTNGLTDPGAPIPAGSVFGGPITCTITAV